MEDTTEARVPGALSALLAGLQAGMLGALWMLAWLGVSSAWQNRGFWNPENLFATAFYGGDAVRSDFVVKTLPGLALYLLVYSLLGGIFALALRARVESGRLMLLGLAYSLGWFFLSFHALWKSALPLVYLLYPDRPMLIGHLIYGVCIGRFPAHYPWRVRRLPPPAPEAPQPQPASPAEVAPDPGPAPFDGPPVAH